MAVVLILAIFTITDAHDVKEAVQLLEKAIDAVQVYISEAANTLVNVYMASRAQPSSYEPHHTGRYLEKKKLKFEVCHSDLSNF